MTILDLSEEPEHISVLAAWHHAEWSYLNPDTSLDERTENMRSYLGEELIPSTFICKDGKCLTGSAAIVKYDMQVHRDWTPWLASVFVAPEYRSHGIGSRLVRHIMGRAKKSGIEEMYLFTPDRETFYQKLGWETILKEAYHDADVTIMKVKL